VKALIDGVETEVRVKGKVSYSSNNSGGSWWLKDEDWQALEAAGWNVEWYRDRLDWDGKPYPDGRYIGGALATNASKEFFSLGEGVAEWERITGERASDAGCSCCGAPHSLTYEGPNGGYESNEIDYDEEDDDW